MNQNLKELYEIFVNEKINPIGACGLLGNIVAESNGFPNNLENSYAKKIGITDAEYTLLLETGEITKNEFACNGAGYGICQWTYPTRKEGLFDFAKEKGLPISSLSLQAEYVVKELKELGLFDKLNDCTTVKEASNLILTRFEMPSNQSEAVKEKRATYGEELYISFTLSPITIELDSIDRAIRNIRKHLM